VMLNLTKLLLQQEAELKKKYGRKYRGPMQRWIDEIVAGLKHLAKDKGNEILPDLPFIEVKHER